MDQACTGAGKNERKIAIKLIFKRADRSLPNIYFFFDRSGGSREKTWKFTDKPPQPMMDEIMIILDSMEHRADAALNVPPDISIKPQRKPSIIPVGTSGIRFLKMRVMMGMIPDAYNILITTLKNMMKAHTVRMELKALFTAVMNTDTVTGESKCSEVLVAVFLLSGKMTRAASPHTMAEKICTKYMIQPAAGLMSMDAPTAPTMKAGPELLQKNRRRSACSLSIMPLVYISDKLRAPTGYPPNNPNMIGAAEMPSKPKRTLVTGDKRRPK